jgi:hypothetical protein
VCGKLALCIDTKIKHEKKSSIQNELELSRKARIGRELNSTVSVLPLDCRLDHFFPR